jgi:hypothetical protein
MKIASIVLLALGSYLLNSNVAEAQDICLSLCVSEKPNCSDGWSPKEFGECWTCCKPDDDQMIGSN